MFSISSVIDYKKLVVFGCLKRSMVRRVFGTGFKLIQFKCM